jgi:3-hydroxyacyl-[acyl-carrier-protein] dehydratase
MLLQDFYKIEELNNVSENKYEAIVILNKDSTIFKGHFPGNPVTPGVCMMQIIKELTEEILSAKLMMTNSSNVKFMALINPDVNPKLQLQLEINKDDLSQIKVKNTTLFDETIALKLTNTYKTI